MHCVLTPTQRSMTEEVNIAMFAVVEGMEVVKKIEAKGSGSGKPSVKITIAKSGEL